MSTYLLICFCQGTNEILNAARALFLKRGPNVTTAEIARAVGISEGSIFKRFPTKHSLFLAAMKVEMPHPWAADLEQTVGQGDLRENLVRLSAAIMSFLRELLPRLMLAWSCNGAIPEHLGKIHGPESPPRLALAALSRYLGAEMELGRMRTTDPEIAARIFLGAIWNHVFLETIESRSNQVGEPLEPEVFARKLVDAVWQGLAPTEEGAA